MDSLYFMRTCTTEFANFVF
ncbi:rCG53441 [Rattus norvegicus]|uniref:RCG53441 n=1 Tax=Rattus norvegicus TaxID=10116 RepID=A6JRN7_RAT|nr:rCG53441 [Rattus norvegicus]